MNKALLIFVPVEETQYKQYSDREAIKGAVMIGSYVLPDHVQVDYDIPGFALPMDLETRFFTLGIRQVSRVETKHRMTLPILSMLPVGCYDVFTRTALFWDPETASEWFGEDVLLLNDKPLPIIVVDGRSKSNPPFVVYSADPRNFVVVARDPGIDPLVPSLGDYTPIRPIAEMPDDLAEYILAYMDRVKAELRSNLDRFLNRGHIKDPKRN